MSILEILTAKAYLDQGIKIRQFVPGIPCELKLVTPAGQALSTPAQRFIKAAKEALLQQPYEFETARATVNSNILANP